MRSMLTIAGFVVAALVATGCGDEKKKKAPAPSTGPAPSPSPPSQWNAAVGLRGTLLQTFDDRLWERRDLASEDLHAITCVGNLAGWVAGDDGIVLHTPDSGETWTRQTTHTTARLHAIHFAAYRFGSYVGVLAGEGGTIGVSIGDDGSTWQLADVPTDTTFRSVTMRSPIGSRAERTGAEHVFIVVGDGGIVARSADEGSSWTVDQHEGIGDVTSVASAHMGQLVVAVTSDGTVLSSDSDGAQFDVEAELGTSLGGVAVAPDGSWAIASGEGGALFVREAPGDWQLANTPTTANLRAAMISHDGLRAYAAGEGGTLLAADALSETWTLVDTPTTVRLDGLENLDPH